MDTALGQVWDWVVWAWGQWGLLLPVLLLLLLPLLVRVVLWIVRFLGWVVASLSGLSKRVWEDLQWLRTGERPTPGFDGRPGTARQRRRLSRRRGGFRLDLTSGPIGGVVLGIVVALLGTIATGLLSEPVRGDQLAAYTAPASATPWFNDPPLNTPPVQGAELTHLTVLAQTTAPPGSVALVTLYGNRDGSPDAELGRFQTVSGSWSRSMTTSAYPRLRIKVEAIPAATASPTTAGSPSPPSPPILTQLYVYASALPADGPCRGPSLCHVRLLLGL